MATAEARREARRKKILNNPDGRMNKIFGVEGKVKEPGLEDGNVYKVSSTVVDSNENVANTEGSERLKETTEPKVDSSKKTDDSKDLSEDPNNDIMSPTVEAVFFKDDRKWYQRRRIVSAAILGAAFRLFVMLNVHPYVIYYWAAYQITLELFHGKTDAYSRVPTGPVVNMLLFCGFSQRVVHFGGRSADLISRVIDDTVMMFFTFLITHCLLEVFLDLPELPSSP